MADAEPDNPGGFLAPSGGFKGLLHNGPCIAAVLAFVVAQVLKVFTYWYSERRWDFTRLIGSGGMPSSHTGCVRLTLPGLSFSCCRARTSVHALTKHAAPRQVIALTTAIGVLKGTGSEAFAVGLVFSLVVRALTQQGAAFPTWQALACMT